VGCVCEQNFKLKSKTNNLAPPFKKKWRKYHWNALYSTAYICGSFYLLKDGKNSWFVEGWPEGAIFMGEKWFNISRVTIVHPRLIFWSIFFIMFSVSIYVI
jgi:hypothetical protein